MKPLKKIKAIYKKFRVWMKKSMLRTIIIELLFGLVVVSIIYFIQDYYYNEKLEKSKNCYTNTIYIGLDQTNYLPNIHFKFIHYKGDTILFRTPKVEPWQVEGFDFSRTYTVRYVCDEPKYNELIFEDWDESKYKKDSEGRLLLK